MFRLAYKYLIRHPLQTGLMTLGIMLGVAVIVAIDLANTSASRAFDLSTDAIAGRATHQIIGSQQGFDATVYTRLRQSGSTMEMTPIVEEFTTSPELGDRPFTLLGIDPFSEGPFRNYFGGDEPVPIELLTTFLTRPGAIILSAAMAERYGLTICPDLIHTIDAADTTNCSLELTINGRKHSAVVAGLLNPADALSQQALESLILADIATAQELTGRLGKIDRIDLILPEDPLTREASTTTSETLLRNQLDPELRIVPVEARSGTIREMTRAFRVNLTALSLLALLVGLFLIYNTITFSVVQRRALFGILRSIGMTPRQIFTLVVGEAILAGLVGSAVGVALGVLLGQGAIQLVTQTINDLFFVVNVRGVQIPTSSLVKGFMVGLIATVLTAAPPGWEAASIRPRIAINRSNLEDKAQKAVRFTALFGLVLTASGSFVLLGIPTDDLIISFTGTFLVIVGFAMLTPAITGALMQAIAPLLGRLFGLLGRMAPRDVTKSVSRTSIAVAALMVAVSVTIGVSVMVNSFRYTVETWLSQTLQGDIYISAPGQTAAQPGAAINPEAVLALQNTPGAQDVALLRATTVDSPRGPVTISAVTYPVDRTHQFIWTNGPVNQIWDKMRTGGVIISEPFANRFNLTAQGASLELFTDQGLQEFPVVGVFYDYGSTQGIVRMEMSVYRNYWQDDLVSAVAIFLEPGVPVEQKTRQLQDQLAQTQTLFIRSNQALRNEALDVFDRTFAITAAMQLLATLIAFVGILSALLALQLDRQRQIGILRAIGLTTRQVWSLVMLQTGLLGAVAGLLALPTGYVLSAILIFIINRRSFGWTLQMQLEPEPFVLAMVIAILAALLAGIYPAYRLQKMFAAEAIRGE
jgi:putative ABC transport system permease protein